MSWLCFLAEDTGRYKQSLRRYSHSTEKINPCPLVPGDHSYHDISVRIEDTTDAVSRVVTRADLHVEPRWPTQCACGYMFRESDEAQLFKERLYRHPETKAEFGWRDAPVGAIIFEPWMIEGERGTPPKEFPATNAWLSQYYYRDWFGKRPPINITCPGRHAPWCPDSGASNGHGWQVTGTLPLITVTPSIGMPQYHGWLNNGVLSDDLEGRTYP